MRKTWKKVEDKDILHVWMCADEDCSRNGVKIIVTPTFYQDSGTPICGNCGEDCIYQHTEVRS
jgi:hypothetical protein